MNEQQNRKKVYEKLISRLQVYKAILFGLIFGVFLFLRRPTTFLSLSLSLILHHILSRKTNTICYNSSVDYYCRFFCSEENTFRSYINKSSADFISSLKKINNKLTIYILNRYFFILVFVIVTIFLFMVSVLISN